MVEERVCQLVYRDVVVPLGEHFILFFRVFQVLESQGLLLQFLCRVALGLLDELLAVLFAASPFLEGRVVD